MFDDHFRTVAYRYFTSEPIVEKVTGGYANPDGEVELNTVSWNHSLSEVVNSLIGQGLEIKVLNEYDYSPYDCFAETVEVAPKKFRIEHLGDKIPMVYAITAQKK